MLENRCVVIVGLKVPWAERRSKQSVLKVINPEYSESNAKAEAPIYWPPNEKSLLIVKDPDAMKD